MPRMREGSSNDLRQTRQQLDYNLLLRLRDDNSPEVFGGVDAREGN